MTPPSIANLVLSFPITFKTLCVKIPLARPPVLSSHIVGESSSMRSGNACLTPSSLKHTNMVWSSIASMASAGGYILVSSRIPQITRKSESLLSSVCIRAHHRLRYNRMLIATLRDKGRCPCPRCKMKFASISGMGTPDDITQRVSGARQDVAANDELVDQARKIIYDEGYVVTSDRVEVLLGEHSMVPTRVCTRHRIFII